MTTTLAIIAIAVSLAALSVACWNARSDSRSAIAAEDAAVSARQSADSGKDSAKSARESAESAAQVARVELGRHHHALEPVLNGRFGFQKNAVSTHMKTLTYQFKLDRDYSVKARLTANQGNAVQDVVVTPPARPDGDWLVHLEDWSTVERAGQKREESDWDPARDSVLAPHQNRGPPGSVDLRMRKGQGCRQRAWPLGLDAPGGTAVAAAGCVGLSGLLPGKLQPVPRFESVLAAC